MTAPEEPGKEIGTKTSVDVVITAGSTGRIYDLGNSRSRLFKLRVLKYRLSRKLHG